MTTTASEPVDVNGPEPDLKRVMGPKLLLLFVVGDILGAGVYAVTGQLTGIVGGIAARNAEIFRTLLDSPNAPDVAGVRDAVRLNAAAALVAYSAAGGALDVSIPEPATALQDRLAAALPAVTDALDSGAAATLLDRWISTSQDLA